MTSHTYIGEHSIRIRTPMALVVLASSASCLEARGKRRKGAVPKGWEADGLFYRAALGVCCFHGAASFYKVPKEGAPCWDICGFPKPTKRVPSKMTHTNVYIYIYMHESYKPCVGQKSSECPVSFANGPRTARYFSPNLAWVFLKIGDL